MLLHLLLFLLYSLGCCFAIIRMPFIRKTNIRPAFLLLFFALHVATGLLHNIIAWRYYPGHGDIWYHFQFSFLYRQRLFNDIHQFIADNNTWTYFTHNSIIFINMLLDLFSGDNLAINTLLFAFPVFLGSIALFRTFRQQFPDTPIAAITVLLLPSTLFWTACIHREGFLYMLIGFLCYTFSRLYPPTSTSEDHSDTSTKHTTTIPPTPTRLPHIKPTRQYLVLLLLIFLIAYFRIVVTLSLLPGLFIWWAAQKQIRSRSILLTLTTTFLLLSTLLYLCPSILNAVIHRQHEFLDQESHSRLPLPALEHSWHSLFQLIPRAIINGLFQPLPGSGGQLIYTAFSLELLVIWAVLLFSLLIVLFYLYVLKFFIKPTSTTAAFDTPAAPFALFCISTSLIGLLLIGCMIPAVGAIVRYRSIYLPLMLAPSLYILRQGRLNRWLEKHLFTQPPPSTPKP